MQISTPQSSVKRGQLPRLPAGYYRGRAHVLWTHTIEQRRTGWLDHRFHAMLREALLHCAIRYELNCPAYVCMPDHLHVVWMGIDNTSDQLLAVRQLRKWTHRHLFARGCHWQRQAHDSVLRTREPWALTRTIQYVLQNPGRANMVESFQSYPYLGAVVPGYPQMDPREPAFWDRFWKIHGKLCGEPGL
jgi:REP element-mobilizing transposase RayT